MGESGRDGGATSSRPGYHPRTLTGAVALSGLALLALGLAAAHYSPTPVYRTPWAGFDPPFDAIGGLLLLVLLPGVRDRSRVAWLFSGIAPGLTIGIVFLSPNPLSITAAGISVALLALLYPSQSRFFRGAVSVTTTSQYGVAVGALLSVLFGVVGARILGAEFDPAPGIRTWDEALYFTILTMSTNGSNYVPVTNLARLFAVALVLGGVATFLSVVVFFVPFLERRLRGVSSRLERSQMEQLTDHLIVCGTSPEARAVAEVARSAGRSVLLLGSDAAAIGEIESEGFRTLLGEPSSEEALGLVGIDRARALVAADPSDAENLLIVITARSMNPGLRIVALAMAPTTVPKLKRAGANEVVSLLALTARHVTDAALRVG